MIHDFTITDLSHPGYPRQGYRCYDATGRRLPMCLKWVDDETGEFERYDVRDGVFQVDPHTHRVATVRGRVPAPVRVIPIKPGETYFTND